MSNEAKRGPGSGLVRGDDGILVWHGGRRYSDPREAVKTWGAGVLRCGCTEMIISNYSSHPCGNIPKHDPDANGNLTRCGMHSASAKAKRKAAQEKRDASIRRKLEMQALLSKANAAVEPALRQIAEGHNDPRSLAFGIIAAIDAARSAIKEPQK